jgi:prolyl-tRNA synthetase
MLSGGFLLGAGRHGQRSQGAPEEMTMRLTTLFGRTMREAPAEAEQIGHQLALRAGLARQLQAGSFALMPLGMLALRRIEAIMHDELARIGAQELRTPIIQSSDAWERTGRYADYGPLMLRVADRSGRRLLVAPTHEEAIADLARREISSYRQLPALVYQIHTKYRDELRTKGGLMRMREFTMLDAYSLDADTAGLDLAYRAVGAAFERILARCEVRSVAAEASAGEMGGSETVEYHVRSAAGEDQLLTCAACGHVANAEVSLADAGGRCARCGGALLAAQTIEIGHIFKLGTRYSDAIGARYQSAAGREQPIVMGSYGIGLERLLLAILEQHHDGAGIVWPREVAPLDLHLVPVGRGARARQAAEALYEDLLRAGARVLYDDRDEAAGVKLADADLIGLPTRLLLSERLAEAGQIEVRPRGGVARDVELERWRGAAV